MKQRVLVATLGAAAAASMWFTAAPANADPCTKDYSRMLINNSAACQDCFRRPDVNGANLNAVCFDNPPPAGG